MTYFHLTKHMDLDRRTRIRTDKRCCSSSSSDLFGQHYIPANVAMDGRITNWGLWKTAGQEDYLAGCRVQTGGQKFEPWKQPPTKMQDKVAYNSLLWSNASPKMLVVISSLFIQNFGYEGLSSKQRNKYTERKTQRKMGVNTDLFSLK